VAHFARSVTFYGENAPSIRITFAADKPRLRLASFPFPCLLVAIFTVPTLSFKNAFSALFQRNFSI